MNIVEFNDLFPNEEACKMKLKEYRERYIGDKLFERLIITPINYKNEFRYNI